MQTLVLSKDEIQFQRDLLEQGLRLDGREALDPRLYTIEMNPLPLSPASCRVLWGNGYGYTTELLVSVSTEVMTIENSSSVLSVKALAGSFGPAVDQDEICQVIKSTLRHFLENSGVLEQSQFIIINSPYSWKLFIDVLVIKASGAVYDASMVGIYHVLNALTFPQLIVTPGETIAELHFDVDETKEPQKIIDAQQVPVVMSFAACPNSFFIDPTPTEITVLQSLLVVGMSRSGKLLGLNHFGECGMKQWILQEVTQKQLIDRIINAEQVHHEDEKE